MRSEQILPDLVSPDWHRFVLSAEDLAHLPRSAEPDERNREATSHRVESTRE
jgi:hypothetical protein